MKTASVKVFWVLQEKGGRELPRGLQYSTVSRWPGQTDEEWEREAWSIVLKFERSPWEQGNPSTGKARFLACDAPDWLEPGRKFELYEGSRKVADVEISEKVVYEGFALRDGNLIALGGNLWNQHVSHAIRNKKADEDDLHAAAGAFFHKVLPEMQNFMEQKLTAAREGKA